AGAGDGEIAGVAAGVDGSVFAVRSVEGQADLGGGATPGLSGTDALVTAFSAVGEHRWSKRLGGIAEDHGWAIAAGAGYVVAAGSLAEGAELRCFAAKLEARSG